MANRDLRVCALGDSLVAGVGDPECRGWLGRIAARGAPMTLYNLGVRRQTSPEVRARWKSEVPPRLPAGVDGRVVLSVGVNDTTIENGRRRVSAFQSAETIKRMVAEISAEYPLLVVGPAPVSDPEQNTRIVDLARDIEELCSSAGVPFVGVFAGLASDPVWLREVAAGDGAHPAVGGYTRFADLVAAPLLNWFGTDFDTPRPANS